MLQNTVLVDSIMLTINYYYICYILYITYFGHFTILLWILMVNNLIKIKCRYVYDVVNEKKVHYVSKYD